MSPRRARPRLRLLLRKPTSQSTCRPIRTSSWAEPDQVRLIWLQHQGDRREQWQGRDARRQRSDRALCPRGRLQPHPAGVDPRQREGDLRWRRCVRHGCLTRSLLATAARRRRLDFWQRCGLDNRGERVWLLGWHCASRRASRLQQRRTAAGREIERATAASPRSLLATAGRRRRRRA